MNFIHRSIPARLLMTTAASLALLMTGAGEGRAESVFVQGADGANAVDGDPDVPATSGESVAATAGSTQPVTAPSNSAFATGGNGGNGGNDLGNGTGQPGGAATARAATTVNSGSAEADATAIGGNGGNFGNGFQNDGYGGYAIASSTAVTNGSGNASSSANATGGATGTGDFGFAGGANAVADAAAAGGGKAAAAAFATGGIWQYSLRSHERRRCNFERRNRKGCNGRCAVDRYHRGRTGKRTGKRTGTGLFHCEDQFSQRQRSVLGSG
jgi:hypothetical protein